MDETTKSLTDRLAEVGEGAVEHQSGATKRATANLYHGLAATSHTKGHARKIKLKTPKPARSMRKRRRKVTPQAPPQDLDARVARRLDRLDLELLEIGPDVPSVERIREEFMRLALAGARLPADTCIIPPEVARALGAVSPAELVEQWSEEE